MESAEVNDTISGGVNRRVKLKIKKLHSWNISAREAVEIQSNLRDKVEERTPAGFKPSLVAAADISCNRFSNTLFAAVVVTKLPELTVIETSTARVTMSFPYIPGLLSFRELPALEAAFESLANEPDLVLMDGQGRAHPRGVGLACHAGLMFERPTVGVAKSVLVGEYKEPANSRGSRVPLIHKDKEVGAVLRTRRGVKPVFVSVGHMIDIDAACSIVLECAPVYRIPEPLRAAHNAANHIRREYYRNNG